MKRTGLRRRRTRIGVKKRTKRIRVKTGIERRTGCESWRK